MFNLFNLFNVFKILFNSRKIRPKGIFGKINIKAPKKGDKIRANRTSPVVIYIFSSTSFAILTTNGPAE
jgi:hypothetical protein